MKKFRNFVIAIILIIACLVCGINVVTKYVDTGYRVSAYLPIINDIDVDSISLDNVTNVYLAFVYIDSENKITLDSPWNENEEDVKKKSDFISDNIKALREKFPNKKISIAVGGYKADGFSDMAISKENRKVFCNSVVEFIQKYNLDGVDIDWEFPVSGGNGAIKCRPEDKENFTALMQELRAALDDIGSNNMKKYELSFAQTAAKEGFENIELEKVGEAVDVVNLMAYDYTGEWSKITKHNANLYAYGSREEQMNTADAIEEYEKMGFNMKKIVLGIPAYGYGWKGVPNENDGLYQPAEESIKALTYKELKSNYINKDGFKRYWDDEAKVPYLYNGDVFISYEDDESAKIKSEYIKDKKLGGAMIWEYTQDDNGELTKTIYDILKKK